LNRTLNMILSNLRTEVNRIVKDNEDKASIINVQSNMIARQTETIKNLEKELGKGVDYDPAP
jgi:hypothetical protein